MIVIGKNHLMVKKNEKHKMHPMVKMKEIYMVVKSQNPTWWSRANKPAAANTPTWEVALFRNKRWKKLFMN